jgi:hypothetical protein
MSTSTFSFIRNDPDDVVHLTESVLSFSLVQKDLQMSCTVLRTEKSSPKTIGTSSTDDFCHLVGGEIKWHQRVEYTAWFMYLFCLVYVFISRCIYYITLDHATVLDSSAGASAAFIVR